ncbi:hypothetical protein [Cryptosporangium sp. NPDC051539]|uniref:hypothetical protein n=1 Tax=Cryptosporangium sp. NPDC051539 TaxID=3363962 RepID=UPI00379F3371
MGVQGRKIFAVTAERGFPEPWLSFGNCLCNESALSTRLKAAIETARKEQDGVSLATVGEVFDAKQANLATAAGILQQVRSEYDGTGEWKRLDALAARLDIADVSEEWGAVLNVHPLPLVMTSLQFNWAYMKEHGVAAFYAMCSEYVAALQKNTARWRTAWTTEVETGAVDILTTVQCDLVSIEAPLHCDACKKTITALLYLDV